MLWWLNDFTLVADDYDVIHIERKPKIKVFDIIVVAGVFLLLFVN